MEEEEEEKEDDKDCFVCLGRFGGLEDATTAVDAAEGSLAAFGLVARFSEAVLAAPPPPRRPGGCSRPARPAKPALEDDEEEGDRAGLW